MKRLVAASILMLLISFPVLAQRDCGDGLPCGKLPWDLPVLPQLPSPTPMPTIAVTTQPTPGPGTPTVAPSPTLAPLNTLDTSGINNQVATLGAVMAASPYIVNDLNGTPVNTLDTVNEVSDNAGLFFGYARSIGQISIGKMSPLLVLALTGVALLIGFKTTTYLLPFIAAAFAIVRKALSLILDFLPF